MTVATHRLFLGIKPKDSELSRLLEIQKTLGSALPAFRLVSPESIHLTLHFLGDINDRMLKTLLDELPSVPFSPGRQSLVQWTAFPKPEEATVVGVGNPVPCAELARLHSALQEKLAVLGIPLEKRDYYPHLTLARHRRPVPLATGELPALEELSLDFESYSLIKSRLDPAGPIYETLGRYPVK